MAGAADEQRRAARRAWIAEHHPDRGGDPAAFAAGLARFDEQPDPDRSYPAGQRPTVRRSRNPVRRVRRWLRSRRRPDRRLR